MLRIERALISVSDKSGIVDFARALCEHGVEIISTGGTAAVLKNAQISVVDVAEYTGSPEILHGRLKTLHPKIHGGILGRRSNSEDLKEMSENEIEPIDMIVVNLYPFEATVAKKGCTFEEAVENIDIGGPTMLRAAAKNHEGVAVVVDPADYVAIIAEMNANAGAISKETRFKLAKKVFATTARYDAGIINYFQQYASVGEVSEWPLHMALSFEKISDLRYGENPHQGAAFYRDIPLVSEPSVINSRKLQGKELSYNNIMDADSVIEIVKEFDDSVNLCAIVKHANPCGVAVSLSTISDAYMKALSADPVSAFGGIVGVNRIVDEPLANLISEMFFEVIAAPAFDESALEILGGKKNLRLLVMSGLGKPFEPKGISLRKVTGGLLLQSRDLSREDIYSAKIVTRRAPTDDEYAALSFGWRICKHVKSNAIVFASPYRTLGIGAGQSSRIDSVKIAVMKMKQIEMGDGAQAIIIASDAFFPFSDSVNEAALAGATAICQPGGSIRDDEIIAAADKHGMAMIFTGFRHFRH